ncbi:hypothetical protein Tco_1153201 [Tanacetum coccineum]
MNENRQSLAVLTNTLAAMGEHNGQVVNAGLGSSLQLTIHHEAEKAKIVSVHLDDKALLWHKQFVKIIGENVGWEMVDINQEHVVSLYLAGLPTELEMNVMMFKPRTLVDAYYLTSLQEVTLEAVRKKNKSFPPSIGGKWMSFGSNSRSPLLALPAPKTSWKSKPNTPVTAPIRKQLSQKENQENRAQNLCFYRDQKYTPGHKCSGHLYYFVIYPDEEEEFFEVE